MAKGDEKKTPPEGEGIEKDPGAGTGTDETSQVDEKPQETERKKPARKKTRKDREEKGTPPPESSNEPTPTVPEVEKEIVQVIVKVHPRIKEKAKQEAELAYMYKWIPEPTVKALFIWAIDTYLDLVIKQVIQQRRGEQPIEATAEQDDSQGG